MLDAMTYKKNPAAFYQSVACNDCTPDLRLFGISDGLGNKMLEMLVYFDKKRKIMCPVAVRRAGSGTA